ncbi:MAG: RNA polymerase sigma factor [Elusimicrobia bacterium]|nr:MAG: RNA polymerase sigma factor [Elusimicrobiota bacterium]KAF0155335.1 MAG: RNA polymerase sigma factor [Elusimicrobiota bacterium]
MERNTDDMSPQGEDNNDAELVRAFRGGDEAALGELIERHRDRLYAYLRRLAGDGSGRHCPQSVSRALRVADAGAEDMFQDTWIKVARNIGAYREENKFSAWLFSVARNTAMDALRRRRPGNVSLDAASAGDTMRHGVPVPLGRPLAETIGSAEPGPEAAYEASESRRAIDGALAELSPEQREVFLLRHYSGMSFREIADALGVPIGTALARASRAAAKLRDKLAGEI